jgi:hypothetical protein
MNPLIYVVTQGNLLKGIENKPLEVQSRYNRGYLSPISDIDFQFLAQDSTEKKLWPIISNF